MNVCLSVDELIQRLHSEKWWVRENTADALGDSADERAVEPLWTATLQDSEPSVRKNAARAIVKVGQPAVRPLVSHLSDTDRHSRLLAIHFLVQIGNAEALQPLLSLFKDQDFEVRLAAIRASGGVGQTEAIQTLLAIVNDTNDGVRGAALQALADTPYDIFHLVCKALSDRSVDVRLTAVITLKKLGGKRAVKPLADALRDSDWHVSEWSATGLGELGDVRAIEPLLQCLRGWHIPFSVTIEERMYLINVVEALKKMGVEAEYPWWWGPLL